MSRLVLLNVSHKFLCCSIIRAGLNVPSNGKSIIDVSRYDGRKIISPHLLFRGCLVVKNAIANNAQLSFRVHHYVGSWESFGLRGLKLFKERNNVTNVITYNTTPYYTKGNVGTWLSQFSMLVGKERALNLTERIRLDEERNVAKRMSPQEN